MAALTEQVIVVRRGQGMSKSTQLPMRHLSIRVPWNDLNWAGTVCLRPSANVDCLILPRIREQRKDDLEASIAGKSWADLAPEQLPPCVSEHGHFMAPYELTKRVVHPYASFSQAHSHFLPTPLRLPAYSAACIPYRWMLRETAPTIAEELDLNYQPDLEKRADDLMGFETYWLQDKHNQTAMLDAFFSAVHAEESFCFFYAKRVPFVEDNRRVIVGVGRTRHVALAQEYKYSSEGELQSVLWERTVQHSIRDGFEDGFVLPYQDVVRYLGANANEDPHKFAAFVPDDQFNAFSYGTEHVTNDGAISALLSSAGALDHIASAIPGPWEGVRDWLDIQLNEFWHMRGPHPGLGSALCAFGIQKGTLLAYEVERYLEVENQQGSDPWPLIDQLLRDPGACALKTSVPINDMARRKWVTLADERRSLLKLLSRFELSVEQATRFYVHEHSARAAYGIQVRDGDLLTDPYLLYERDRRSLIPIELGTIDRGVFPEASLRTAYPLPDLSRIGDPTDPRRVRAFVVDELERAAESGHTLLARHQVIANIRDRELQPPCPVDGDLMDLVESDFTPAVQVSELKDGSPAYQLTRMSQIGEVIRSAVARRVKGARHEGNVNWRRRLDGILGGPADPEDREEQAAREEKSIALEELFASRVSVLIGPAGTGKTTLLKVLCREPSVEAAGVLLLAPTGKARVRMETETGIQGAKTIAQFLLPLRRYDPDTGLYDLSDFERADEWKTVVIDEASMLTEEQLAATLDALKGVERLVLVGDPRQLPPIGAGRPFLDIVRHLAPEGAETKFPRVGPGYADLTIRRRQRGELREDLLLAEWFSGRSLDPGADEIWEQIEEREEFPHLQFLRWDSEEELQKKLLETLGRELGLEGPDDVVKFELSLGGTERNGWVYFNAGRDDQLGAGEAAENWQILSPVRGMPHGVEALNRAIQSRFRSRTKESARRERGRKIARPMGPQEIVYGDKVINIVNHRHRDVWPETGSLEYIANGEIGIVVGQFRHKKMKGAPWKLEVEFASQPSFKYGFSKRWFGEESDPYLELAYALTVHKAQGSEFEKTFLVLPNPCRLLSRELLYTALTRQRDRIIVLHQGDRHELRRFSHDHVSESASRLTNLFGPANPVMLRDRFLEDGLIHRTLRGESVRSKSEVIIANMLHEKGIDYEYELPLSGTDGTVRYPDFTVEDTETGRTYYWEHLGLLSQPAYRMRWEAKLSWYRAQGIQEYENSPDAQRVLIATMDDPQGGIDSRKIEQWVRLILE
jgi:hypothetical protein